MVQATILAWLAVTTLLACGGSPGVGGSSGRSSAVPPGSGPSPMTSGAGLRYVALGDSYTIGTSVGVESRWPNQLVIALGRTDAQLDLVSNLAVNGFTSRDVIDVELPRLETLRPEFVTLLVGVNDVVQGVPADTYRQNVATILDELLARVGAARILVVTTPDYTVTPAGADYGDPVQQRAGIRASNQIVSSLAAARGITVVDIHDISVRAAGDRSLVASDGLHPSGEQYALWIERIAPAVETLLGR